jgi:radical SAM superfamily enzyme YgiQ (UPF0313 family)
VREEILGHLKLRGIRDFAFYDDALLHERHDHLLPLLRALIEDGAAIRLHTPNGLHARFIDRETASLLKRAGFVSLKLSLETSDAGLQAATGGKVTNSEFASAVEALRTAGYRSDQLRTYVLAGMPGQAPEDVRESIRFVRESGAWPEIAAYSMIPGTADWERHKTSLGLDSLDPVTHNNTVFAAKMGWMDFGTMEELKQEARASAVTR